jgi:HlyD family secretion protein
MNHDIERIREAGKIRWWLLLAVVLVLALVALALIRRDPAAGEAPAPAHTQEEGVGAAQPALTVGVAIPEPRTLELTLQANGTVAAWQEASIGAELSGLRLRAVHVDVGDVVRKGQLLAELSSETTRAENLQAQAVLAQAEAAWANAKADADRARAIQDSGALSESQIAQYLTQEKVAAAQLEAARAAYAATQVRLANTEVRAPDDGIVSARPATVGSVVNAGQELFRIVRQGRLEWRAELTAAEVERVSVGQKVRLTSASGRELDGTVRAIAPTADPLTRNVLVYVDLPRDTPLKAGSYARGVFLLGSNTALTVPAPSVVVRDGHSYVFVIGDDGRAQARRIVSGRRVDDRVEVIEGLQAGERIAVQGAGFLNDGDLVRIATE